jgi:hypothetical protein
MDAVYAMDTIQGCGAKLIWVTPKMREEWRRKEQSVRQGGGIQDMFALIQHSSAYTARQFTGEELQAKFL